MAEYNYRYNASPDPYCYPNSSVLINKKGITDAVRLSAVEREVTARKLAQLMKNPVNGRFGFTHLKNIHKAIFDDIFEWAGTPRQQGFISKGQTIFTRGEYIDQEAARIFNSLAADNKLKGLPVESFVKKLAYYDSELNALHPFREGNGRSRREFIRQLSAYNGYTLLWSRVPKNDILAADIAAFDKNYAALISVLCRVLGV